MSKHVGLEMWLVKPIVKGLNISITVRAESKFAAKRLARIKDIRLYNVPLEASLVSSKLSGNNPSMVGIDDIGT